MASQGAELPFRCVQSVPVRAAGSHLIHVHCARSHWFSGTPGGSAPLPLVLLHKQTRLWVAGVVFPPTCLTFIVSPLHVII